MFTLYECQSHGSFSNRVRGQCDATHCAEVGDAKNTDLSGQPGFTCWISFALVFSFILLSSLHLCFISCLHLDLYVLGDDALIS